MPDMSLRQAVAAGFASRASIYRAVKHGSLSFKKDEKGHNRLDTADLVRVFGEPKPKALKQSDETNQDVAEQVRFAAETAAMKERLASLEREQARMERELEEAKERESFLRNQLQSQTKLLEDARPAKKTGFFGLFKKS